MMDAAAIGDRLEVAFRRIARERMADIPILNPEIEVEAVGFQSWEEEHFGVLVTPWFMNLMLLPHDEANDEPSPRSGDKACVTFPAGEFEFIYGNEDEIGRYRMCSLFSPMFEFEDHAAAVATAREVLKGIMEAPAEQQASEPRPAMSRRSFLRGGSSAPAEQPR
ncbi:MAG: [NiFe]-hydrogenase assembly chaperone HybE [Pseudomonadota bacterium]